MDAHSSSTSTLGLHASSLLNSQVAMDRSPAGHGWTSLLLHRNAVIYTYNPAGRITDEAWKLIIREATS